jgi:hypothetical protein
MSSVELDFLCECNAFSVIVWVTRGLSFIQGLHGKLNWITWHYQMEIVWINGVNACLVCEWSHTRHEVSEFNNFAVIYAVGNWKKTEPEHMTSIYCGRLGLTPWSLVYGRECSGGTSAFMFYIEEGVSRSLRNVLAYRPDYTIPHPITQYKFCYFWAPMILRVGRKDKLGLFTLCCLKKFTRV